MHTDASKFAIGGVLTQGTDDVEEGDDRVMMYFSRKLKHVETRYPTYERELLATKEAILNFWYFLHGQPFTVSTDCKEVTCRVYSVVTTLQGYPDILSCDLNKHGSCCQIM